MEYLLSPDNVPWVIKNYSPYEIIKSQQYPLVWYLVKKGLFTGLLLVPHGDLLQS
jgi:hypothetical protein